VCRRTRRSAVRRGSRGWGSTPTTAPSRTRWLAGDRGAPGQGLLPRARRRRAGAQPGPAARAGWCCCTSTGRTASCRCRRAGAARRPRRRPVGTAVGHHELGRSRLRWSSATCRTTLRWLAGAVAGRSIRRPEDDVPVSAARQAAAARERLLRLR
jgi:hypothetical protein